MIAGKFSQMPAELTRWSILPCLLSMEVIARSTEVGDETSTKCAVTRAELL